MDKTKSLWYGTCPSEQQSSQCILINKQHHLPEPPISLHLYPLPCLSSCCDGGSAWAQKATTPSGHRMRYSAPSTILHKPDNPIPFHFSVPFVTKLYKSCPYFLQDLWQVFIPIKLLKPLLRWLQRYKTSCHQIQGLILKSSWTLIAHDSWWLCLKHCTQLPGAQLPRISLAASSLCSVWALLPSNLKCYRAAGAGSTGLSAHSQSLENPSQLQG